MSKLNLEDLHKKWVHSSEEDTDTQMVYRPANYRFPPVRGGRTSMDIKADGTVLTTGGAGPDDRQTEEKANWKLNDNTFVLHDAASNKKNLKIVSLAQDKLVIEK